MADLYDYVSPNFGRVDADPFFPLMRKGPHPGMRTSDGRERICPHWYRFDRRWPSIGFVACDEAHILYNTALRFPGKRALEIGCHAGYSSWHLLAGGIELSICDPVLNRAFIVRETLHQSLAFFRGNYHLCGHPSPAGVVELSAKFAPWSLIFIDGDHAMPYPMIDTLITEQFAAEDAMILFHDVWSPGVIQAVMALKSSPNWNVRVYETHAFMAAAWRGDVEPVDHIPDQAIVAETGVELLPEIIRPRKT